MQLDGPFPFQYGDVTNDGTARALPYFPIKEIFDFLICGLVDNDSFSGSVRKIMEIETETDKVIIHESNKPPSFGTVYIKSFPGIVRVLNSIFGLIALILVLPGFRNDFPDEDIEEKYDRGRKPHFKLTYDGKYDAVDHYFGVGYSYERPNVAQLVCIIAGLTFSSIHLLILVTTPGCHSGSARAWNRFLNLTAAIIQGVGLLSGIFGVLLFRSHCCHVQFSRNERSKSELEGYTYFREPCLCYFIPTWEGHEVDGTEYKTLYYHDVPDEIQFHRVLPHHFIPHAISLCFMAVNMVAFVAASVSI